MVAPRRRSLELIPNEGTRKMTFRKRKKSIYKKADELSKLCDIDVCLIVYEADQKKGRAVQPETWPRDPTQFKRILNKYKDSKDTSAPGLKRNFNMSIFMRTRKITRMTMTKSFKI
ncbi:agamous-like MADS-box protein AGL82 [Prunus yedoensis var. nudiflora]|uniref:Agamous-like MADS-box protein AGL82 n=1 Tax=Prunus yedoensis var. nudiflora TaxID=2094558 RepID=A0A314UQJ0_PRUYE|nr:agamous-like MADS-box protein AGL82 [Prunus yedoensis var. nudiflora]